MNVDYYLKGSNSSWTAIFLIFKLASNLFCDNLAAISLKKKVI